MRMDRIFKNRRFEERTDIVKLRAVRPEKRNTATAVKREGAQRIRAWHCGLAPETISFNLLSFNLLLFIPTYNPMTNSNKKDSIPNV